MTQFRTPFKAWLDMLAEINWEYELANPPMQDSTELGLALDFATDVIRTFKRL